MYVCSTQSCTHLPDHDNLCQVWNPHRCVDASELYTLMSNLDCCSYSCRVIVLRLFLYHFSLNRVSCFSVDKVVIVFLILHIFWLFLPQKKSLLEVGSYSWMLTTVPHRRWVCLSFLVGPQPVIWGSSGGLRFQVLWPWMSRAASLCFLKFWQLY